MQKIIDSNNWQNPLSDLISDDIYRKLESRGLINEKSIRDYKMRTKFRNLRRESITAAEAINMIRQEHPYLQPDTIRKIVYQTFK